LSKCIIWCCHDLFYWSILAVFPESIALVVDSRESIVLPDGNSHNGRFPSYPIKYNITFGVNPSFAFVVPHFASTTIFFKNYCRMLSTFNSLSIFSKMIQFCPSNWKFGSLIFFSNHVAPKHQAWVSSLNANVLKWFYNQCLAPQLCRNCSHDDFQFFGRFHRYFPH